MQDLIAQERFEMEVLDRLNSGRFLRFFIFCGGTMLRLCHGLDRFSVDLDFWMTKPEEGERIFKDLGAFLSKFYSLKDEANKFYTLIFELRSPNYPRSLKIEIRKESRKPETEQAIAYSPYSLRQVLLCTVTLPEMMAQKTAAFLDRGEIRDAYDMEFLVTRGIAPVRDRGIVDEVLRRIQGFTQRDYAVKLGSLLESGKRQYYREHHFRILMAALQGK
jgi:predicted nucleotidyltransferase component of viral defense system